MNFVKGLLNGLWMSAIIWLLLIGLVWASPFLTCDPQTGVATYELTGWTPTTVTAQSDGSLRMDVASAVVGTTPLTVKACNVWGCSVAVPFDLVRPVVVSVPSGLRLAQ